MLPIFIGLAVWILICAVIVLVIIFSLTTSAAILGFRFLHSSAWHCRSVCRFLGRRVVFQRTSTARSCDGLAFYLGFLLCGAIGSALGLVGGFVVWKRLRRQTGLTIESQN
jgi:uncharacterized membrane protein